MQCCTNVNTNPTGVELGGLTPRFGQALQQFYGDIDNGLIATGEGVDWYGLITGKKVVDDGTVESEKDC